LFGIFFLLTCFRRDASAIASDWFFCSDRFCLLLRKVLSFKKNLLFIVWWTLCLLLCFSGWDGCGRCTHLPLYHRNSDGLGVERARNSSFSKFVLSTLPRICFHYRYPAEHISGLNRTFSLPPANEKSSNRAVVSWWTSRTTFREKNYQRTASRMRTIRPLVPERENGVWQKRQRRRLDWDSRKILETSCSPPVSAVYSLTAFEWQEATQSMRMTQELRKERPWNASSKDEMLDDSVRLPSHLRRNTWIAASSNVVGMLACVFFKKRRFVSLWPLMRRSIFSPECSLIEWEEHSSQLKEAFVFQYYIDSVCSSTREFIAYKRTSSTVNPRLSITAV